MKSSALNVGNVNLRGKRSGTLRCGCCDIEDLRPKVRDVEHRKEMLNWREDVLQETDYDYEPKFDDFNDRGHWEIFQWDDKVGVISSEFKHDAVMYITGDFGSMVERLQYAAMIAARLNRTNPRIYEEENYY